MPFTDQIDMPALEAFCRRWRITELSLFGSALRNDMRPDSDVDVMVSFDEGCEPALFEFSRLVREIGELLERDVDVVTRRGVEESRNPYRRREILGTAVRLYAA